MTKRRAFQDALPLPRSIIHQRFRLRLSIISHHRQRRHISTDPPHAGQRLGAWPSITSLCPLCTTGVLPLECRSPPHKHLSFRPRRSTAAMFQPSRSNQFVETQPRCISYRSIRLGKNNDTPSKSLSLRRSLLEHLRLTNMSLCSHSPPRIIFCHTHLPHTVATSDVWRSSTSLHRTQLPSASTQAKDLATWYRA